MILNRLIVKQFRNIEACDLELSSGFNFFIGQNGSGKTSLLESVYFLGHGRSFRTSLTSRVIQHQHEQFFVHAKLNQLDGTELPIGLMKKKDGSSEVKIAGQSGQKLSQLAQVLPLQFIHTEGFELLTEGPKFRRSYIDWGVFHTQPLFFQVWGRFKRLVKQRNALLKTARSYQELVSWDKELTVVAEQITQWREEYIQSLTPVILSIAEDFLPEFEINIQGYKGWTKEKPYHEVLKDNFERDQQLGYTYSGPNKADLKIKINGTPVEDILSRGQLKLMVCAMRLAQGQHFFKSTGNQCIYLIDDFASELDIHRRQCLGDYLTQTQAQVFISAITPDHLAQIKGENSKMFYVERGKIEQR